MPNGTWIFNILSMSHDNLYDFFFLKHGSQSNNHKKGYINWLASNAPLDGIKYFGFFYKSKRVAISLKFISCHYK